MLYLNRTLRSRRRKLDYTWIFVIMTSFFLLCSVFSLMFRSFNKNASSRKYSHLIDWDGRIYVAPKNKTNFSRKSFYQYSSPRSNMCFFSSFLEEEGMPKLHSAFADPVSHNVVFIGTRLLEDNWTRETFVTHFESGERRLCDPIVEDYFSFGYISQFNIVLTCPLPPSLHHSLKLTLSLQRMSNVKKYRRYAYDNLTICQSGSSNFQRYHLSACTMVRNMDHYLPEWIAIHRYVGVQHFFLYDNEPEETSKLRQTVRREIAEGVVTVIPWTHIALGQKTYLEVQIAHENDCLWRNRYRTKWMIKIDVDEFVQPMNESKRKITDYLEGPNFETMGAARLQNWFFGRHSADNSAMATNGSIIERNIWRPSYPSPQNCGRDKNIIQPKHVHYFKIHAIKVGGEAISLNPYSELRLVHYRQDNSRVRHFDLPPFTHQDYSMVKLIREARKAQGDNRSLIW
ncbi:uncharacterized protein LOC129266779 [Lytechinus pictus]|uniref:uncharacterized protein LOC129266779 n=1 Tax=Lytechinus pictus TaxID=7653 RepID=UPI0030B9FE7F